MTDQQQTEKPKVQTAAWREKIGELIVAGMRRFSDSDNNPLWRLEMSRDFGKSPLISQDATISDLIKLRAFCDKAIEALKTDGGRNDH